MVSVKYGVIHFLRFICSYYIVAVLPGHLLRKSTALQACFLAPTPKPKIEILETKNFEEFIISSQILVSAVRQPGQMDVDLSERMYSSYFVFVCRITGVYCFFDL